MKYVDASFKEPPVFLMVGLELNSNFARCTISEGELLRIYVAAHLCRILGIRVTVDCDVVVFAGS